MPEKTISSKIVHDGHIRVRVDEVEFPDGRRTTREIVEHRGVIVVVPIDDAGNVLMVRQYRYAVGKELLEIPAGGIDGQETPEQAAIREMQEETGYLPQKLVKLGGFYSAPGYTSEFMHLFLATGLSASRLVAEDTEEIKLERLPVSKIRQTIASGKIEDAKTIAGLLMYLEFRKKLKS